MRQGGATVTAKTVKTRPMSPVPPPIGLSRKLHSRPGVTTGPLSIR